MIVPGLARHLRPRAFINPFWATQSFVDDIWHSGVQAPRPTSEFTKSRRSLGHVAVYLLTRIYVRNSTDGTMTGWTAPQNESFITTTVWCKTTMCPQGACTSNLPSPHVHMPMDGIQSSALVAS